MKQTFLEFEKPVQNIIEQIEKLKEVAAQGEGRGSSGPINSRGCE